MIQNEDEKTLGHNTVKVGVYHVVDLKKEEVVVMVTKSLFSFLCLFFHESSILDQRFFQSKVYPSDVSSKD